MNLANSDNMEVSKSVIQYCCSAPNCGKVYNTRFNLKRHIDITHLKKKKFKCTICLGFFASHQSLQEHRNLHSGARPFVCSFCNCSFRQASQLSLHKRTHAQEAEQEEDAVGLEESSEEEPIFEALASGHAGTKLPLPPALANQLK